ncbi:MAG: tetratricopeptide repeat protein [Rhodocyclaceae bacterium]|nr:tetratricopeptide repeat protein [Rhodocyclaceae bacterium]
MVNIKKGFRGPSLKELNRETEKLLALFNRGDAIGLEPEARKFIRKYPDHLFGHKALSASLTLQEKNQEALVALEEALRKFPLDTELHNNHAAALIRSGRFEEAIESAQRAIDLAPGNGGAYANKGLALKQLGYWHPALQAYQKAIELNPNDYQSLYNGGMALMEFELFEPAVQCLEAALAVKPDYADARVLLASAQEQLKFSQNARKELESVVNANPDHDEARSKLFQALESDCEFDLTTEQASYLLQRIRSGQAQGDISVFPILSMDGATLNDQRKAGRLHADARHGSLMQRAPRVAMTRPIPPNRPLRIGYLSADFHHHATLMLMIGILEAHDRNKVDIYAYSYGIHDGSPLRARAENACRAFRQIKPLSFTEAADLIVQDEIDILVDLKGYTKDNRLEICALRPAPIIVSWLGYPGSLGHPRLADYVIGDPIVSPLEHQPDYSETLALMPHSYQPNDDGKPIGHRPSRQDVGLPEDAFVLCSFNQPYKINAPVFAQWCRILKTIPQAVMWLMVGRQEVREKLCAYAEQYGVEKSRFIFASQIDISEHLQRLQCADLALDTFPYGSHTTGSDALWAGVPLVAIKGNTFASRVSASLLSAIGLTELITDSPEAAADLAIVLAQDRSRLEAVREKLQKNRRTKPLFDTQGFTRDLERLYLRMAEQHGSGIRKPIVLTP